MSRELKAILILGVCAGTVLGCERATPEAPGLAPIPATAPATELTVEPEVGAVNDEAQLDALALACDGAALREQFAARTPAQLDALASAGPPSLAMLAAWERGRGFDAEGVLAPASVDRLAKQIEVALGLAAPKWWLEQLASGRQRAGDETGPPYYDVGLRDQADRRGAWELGPGGLRVRPGAAMVLSAANGTLSFDLSMGRVQLGPLPTDPGSAIEVARARAGTTIYYSTFSPGSGGFRFPLRAVDSNGSLRWEAQVCGPDRKVLGGLGYLSVEILVVESPPPSPDSRTLPGQAAAVTGVAVFTAESHGVALDVFDPQTGARTLAWSSDFWSAR
ncbi:hypothetical protein DB30_02802 [Enhygromyxa salina]|uniref:Uncharacterized protein n=1 Tax=Enhygromyxa salina TaxID=215803 RepID=A0A0C1ZJX5_9BACT|nr:hypothetical protein [Enhygromyxa salina]KIG17769.1 hypothetical protein DB30_02802 [Enhygromyxa salina]